MANPIDLIITKEALKAIETAISNVDALDKKMQSTANNFIESSRKIASISNTITPTIVNNKGADSDKLNADLDKLKAKYESLTNAIAKSTEQRRLAEIKLQQQREKAFDSFEKNAKKEEAALKKAEGNYQRLQNSVNLMTKAYNDLAVRKQLGGTLTDKEEKQLASLQKRVSDYNAVLLKVDSQIGKNQRNVGNYASGYNALGNSINQLTREAPAFANSLNTGFMAISNNIPALTDAIKGIREQNALLRAEGKPTVSVFKQLAGGILSWQTAISLGVTLLTLYGGKLIDMAFGLSEAEKAQKALNEEMDNAKNTVTSEATQLQSLTSIVLDHNESQENRKLAYDKIKETLPGLTSATYEESIATGELTKATDLYILSLVQKNIVETEAKLIAEEQTKLNKETAKSYTEQIGKVEAFLQSLQPDRQRKNIEKSMKAQIKAEQDAQQEIINNRKKALVKAQEDYLKTQAALTPFITDPKKGKTPKPPKEDVTPKVQALESSLKSVGTVLEQLDKQIDETRTKAIVGLAQSTLGMTPEEIKKYKEDNAIVMAQAASDLDKLIELKSKLIGLPEATSKIINTTEIKESTEAVKQLSEEMKNYLKTFSIDFAQNSGFTETFAILNDEIEGFGENFAVTFNAIAESAQEVFNFISNASQQNFEKEKERLQSQYDIALTYAGDNKAAQEKLADDLAKKKEEIANRENKAKQQQAKFNIAIDTAQALIGLWANPGFPQAIPLSIVVGALGLAQIAMVNSQEIPKYWMGGTHDGGLMMVNDGQGSNYKETIVTPDGKIMKPQGRNVIMDAPIGTEIYTHDQWNDKLTEMLQGKGISMSLPQQHYGMTKDDMRDVMFETLGEQPQYHSNFDEDGVVKYYQKRGNRTRINNARSNGRGTKF